MSEPNGELPAMPATPEERIEAARDRLRRFEKGRLHGEQGQATFDAWDILSNRIELHLKTSAEPQASVESIDAEELAGYYEQAVEAALS